MRCRAIGSTLLLIRLCAASTAAAQTNAPVCPLSLQVLSSQSVEFSYITDVAVNSKGLIYVADRFAAGLTVLNPEGRLSHRIGRAGDGPGEFRFVRNVFILPGDSVAAYDLRHGRLTVFTPDAEVAYAVDFARAGPRLRPPQSILLNPTHRRILAQYADPYHPGQDPEVDMQPTQVVRGLDWTGRPLSGFLLKLPGPQSLVARTARSTRIGLHPFGLPSLVRLGPDGHIYFGRGDSLVIRIFNLNGEEIRGIRREYQPPSITRDDLAWGLRQVSNVLQPVLRRIVPDRWPAFRHFVVDDSGRIWIGLDTPRGEQQVWAVLNRSGEVLCRALLDDDVQIVLVRGNTAYAIAKDELDVPRIGVFSWQSAR